MLVKSLTDRLRFYTASSAVSPLSRLSSRAVVFSSIGPQYLRHYSTLKTDAASTVPIATASTTFNHNNNDTTTVQWPATVGLTGPGIPSIPDHFLQNRFATVPNRAFLQLSGEDTAKFLQGLITNNMSNIATGGDGFNAVFLTPQGRVLSEVFIYPRNRGVAFPHPVFLIDCPSAQRDILLAHLRKYRLRSKVTIEPIEDYTVSSVWGPGTSQLWWRHHSIQNTEAAKWPAGQLIKQNGIGFADIGMLDCRATGMGYRVVTHKEHPLNLPSCFTELTSDDYNTWRILRGVTEGVDDFVSNQSLPLECNLDYMHGVDFRKGCYVGQELTIRTYHKGVIRKRIMPVQLIPATIPEDQWTLVPFSFPSEALPVPGTDMQLYERGALDNNSTGSARSRRAPARLCSVSTNMNVALALLRLEHVQEGRVFLVPGATSQSPNWLAKPWIPQWWPKIANEATSASIE